MAIRIGSGSYSQPAARIGDAHVCKHGGGPVDSGSPNVNTNSKRAARATDKAKCSSGPDYIVTGSATVHINGKPASRITSKSMHSGKVTGGSNNVNIGGPDAGCTLGDPDKAREACEKESKTRVSGGPKQSYNDCGLEASRLLMQGATGSSPTEKGLLEEATGKPAPALDTPIKDMPGSSNANSQSALLTAHGVSNSTILQTPDAVTQSVADGKGVITSHEAGTLWDRPDINGGHGIVPTGIDYGPDGEVSSVHTVDSGQGSCDRAVPGSKYFGSMYQPNVDIRGAKYASPLTVVTNNKIW